MENSNLLYVYLSLFLTLEEIGVPVVVYLIYKYLEEKRMKHVSSSTYYKITWFMIAILVLCAIEATLIVFYLIKWLEVNLDILIPLVTIFFLVPVVGFPISLLIIWIMELK